MTALNSLRREHNRLHPTGAHLVDCCRVRGGAEAGMESDLARGGLADAGLNDIAEVDLLNNAWVNGLGF